MELTKKLFELSSKRRNAISHSTNSHKDAGAIPVSAFFCARNPTQGGIKMSNEEILSRLSQLTIAPSEAVYAITERVLLLQLVKYFNC